MESGGFWKSARNNHLAWFIVSQYLTQLEIANNLFDKISKKKIDQIQNTKFTL